MAHSIFTSLLVPETKVTGDQLATEEGILALGANLRALNRRRFLSTLAAAGAAATVGGALAGRTAQAQTTTTPPVVDVLNFALNFEFLEAEYYSFGLNGQSLAQNVTSGIVTSTAPSVTGDVTPTNVPTVTFNDSLGSYELAVIKALLEDEAHHIAQLQAAITANGGTPITEPQIDFSANGKFPAVNSNTAYFALARQFTALGNSAYSGAAADLVSIPAVLQAAGQILGAEAQHLGAITYLLGALSVTPSSQPVYDVQIDVQDVVPFTSSTSGFPNILTVTPVGAVPYNGTSTPPQAPPALGILRTPPQVLGVAYGVSTPTSSATPTTGVVQGGFFPNGVNGNIKST